MPFTITSFLSLFNGQKFSLIPSQLVFTTSFFNKPEVTLYTYEAFFNFTSNFQIMSTSFLKWVCHPPNIGEFSVCQEKNE